MKKRSNTLREFTWASYNT